MTAILPTRLEHWLKGRLAPRGLSIQGLAVYQLDHLNRTLDHVRKNSPFYRQRLETFPDRPLADLGQTADLPLTTAEDLRRHHLDMLCVSHGAVTRVVTMQTSGTTAMPKRLYFSETDLEGNIDFFHHGLACLVDPGQTVLILLPSTTPDSAGDQLKRAAARIPVSGHIHWPVLDLERLLQEIEAKQVDCLVGAPAQIFALCRFAQDAGRLHPNPIKSVLLTTDYVPQVVVDELRRVWDCEVFEHYGMSEMGLGCGLECGAHQGYHLLLVEVIHPESGIPLPPGVEGEVAFTTLTRKAMPLIRYRTGDRAAWLHAPCACGTVMRRLGKVRGRLVDLTSRRSPLSMPQLDEAILRLPGIHSYQALLQGKEHGRTLALTLFCLSRRSAALKKEVLAVVGRLFERRAADMPTIRIHALPPEMLRWDSTGMIKRTLG